MCIRDRLCTAVPAILLLIYQGVVRYTWIGTMLNGRRVRRAEVSATVQPSSS